MRESGPSKEKVYRKTKRERKVKNASHTPPIYKMNYVTLQQEPAPFFLNANAIFFKHWQQLALHLAHKLVCLLRQGQRKDSVR